MSNAVYYFGGNATIVEKFDKNLLGGKGANLCEMSKLGIPVPPGFVIPTSECHAFYANNNSLSQNLQKSLSDAINHIENSIGNGANIWKQ